jgi:hypothetical protein
MREGGLKASVRLHGSWLWKYPSGNSFTVNYLLDTVDQSCTFVRLWYSWVSTSKQAQESADYRVQLTATRPRFGGLRWWFICPLVVNGRPCNRRFGTLHLPPQARYFGCRHCYNLTYTSCQESHKDDRHYRWLAGKMGQSFATVKRMISSLSKS